MKHKLTHISLTLHSSRHSLIIPKHFLTISPEILNHYHSFSLCILEYSILIYIGVDQKKERERQDSSPHISGSFSIRMFVNDPQYLNRYKPVVGSRPSSYISSPPIEPK